MLELAFGSSGEQLKNIMTLDHEMGNLSAYTHSFSLSECLVLQLTTAREAEQGTEKFFSKLNLDWMFW